MSGASSHRYLIALGSNQRHPAIGAPRAVLAAALGALAEVGVELLDASPFSASAPIGPSQRRYANAAALVETPHHPPALLAALQSIEQVFGRDRRGQRWRARVLDLDIVLWDGGIWVSGALAIPHPQFRTREFVLRPAAAIAPQWRDPVSGFSLRQLAARLARRRALSR
ncbi:2-amino-4-hydroxy-6-hydroxymethyldihydropteridine diphosphokinase [Qipengyuania marisflavi]|uniref:2-amino-4-hydroxy-6-hydroxymethyldihydropteridine pyrophosphokinase n=1 Tax=Qipengyuania marisflavi TaxID=2486356 RepID=A0A5S3P2I9_9SPHN|nr:2-amino-4-hydroxy-6-hydroxymethyldihydropteridine diphosphokinase [Qipengyuania marisflavi]TMM47123.1 2-amino-4-hydroxy-6-hydroxymethyldihydropteridine diphosphokinase [Qipengyuania marisflavi]